MSKRKAGWYWVKDAGQWECLWFNGMLWDGQYRDEQIEEIGPRIPTPDELWQTVPVEPTREMLEITGDNSAEAYAGMLGAWTAMLAAAPKPEEE